jgi:hypothetical protein
MTCDELLLFVVKQQRLTNKVVTCYEAGAFGCHLHRRLEEFAFPAGSQETVGDRIGARGERGADCPLLWAPPRALQTQWALRRPD